MTITRAAAPAAPSPDTTTRPIVPAPRRSPEQTHEQTQEETHEESRPPDEAADFPLYPLVRYALDHATALRPRRD
jgi:hypothetical protein